MDGAACAPERRGPVPEASSSEDGVGVFERSRGAQLRCHLEGVVQRVPGAGRVSRCAGKGNTEQIRQNGGRRAAALGER